MIYAKSPEWKPNFIDDPSKRKHFKNPDNDPRGPWFDGNPVNNPGWRPNLQFDITAPNGNIIKHPQNGWRWSMETIEEKLKTGELRFSDDQTRLIRRTYLYELGGLTPSNLWTDLETTGHTRRAKYDLKKIFPEVKVTDLFSTPKPSLLIEYILRLATDGNSIVLDAFAGSGTTAHAVLNMNKADDGNRKFILIEMMDYADSITAERVKRVIDGYGEGKNAVEGTGGNFSFYDLGESLMNGEWLNEQVAPEKIREYVWFMETKQPYAPEDNGNCYYLGKYNNTSYYFFYEPQSVTVLDYAFLATITEKTSSMTIYADRCSISIEKLSQMGITFKKIPRDISRL